MKIKKAINKVAKCLRKEAKVDFVDSITLAKWMFHKASYDKVKSISGFVCHVEYDYTHDVDKSLYLINGKDLSSLYRRAIYGA